MRAALILIFIFFSYTIISGQSFHEEEEKINKAIGLNDSGSFHESLLLLQDAKLQLYVNYSSHSNFTTIYVTVLEEIGQAYLGLEKLDSAQKYLFEAEKIVRASFSTSPKMVSKVYLLIGDLNVEKANYAFAAADFKLVEKMYLEGGSDSLQLPKLYNKMAFLYKEMDSLDLAYIYQTKAVSMAVNVLGDKHPKLVPFYSHLGQLEHKQGMYNECYSTFQKSIAICELGSVKKHSLAKAYEEFAIINWQFKKYDTALIYFNKAMPIYLEELGEESYEVSTCYYNLGLLYNDLNDYDRSLEFHLKDLKISVKIFGVNHPGVAMAYNRVGVAYYNKEFYDESLHYYHKSLEIYKVILPADHTDVSYVYTNMADVLIELNKKKQAMKYATMAYEIRKKHFGDDHPLTKESLNNLNYLKE